MLLSWLAQLDSVQFGSISLNPIYSDFMLSLIQCMHCRNQSNPPSTVPCHAQVIHPINSWSVEQQEAECIEGDRRESLCPWVTFQSDWHLLYNSETSLATYALVFYQCFWTVMYPDGFLEWKVTYLWLLLVTIMICMWLNTKYVIYLYSIYIVCSMYFLECNCEVVCSDHSTHLMPAYLPPCCW